MTEKDLKHNEMAFYKPDLVINQAKNIFEKDIFSLGYCDHSSLPLCILNYLCSHSSRCPTNQALINCKNSESCESNCDSPYSDICPFFHKRIRPQSS
jgi:hypothetical protein